MRTLLILVALSRVAAAETLLPRPVVTGSGFRAAERAWRAAETERRPSRRVTAWIAAAEAYDRAVSTIGVRVLDETACAPVSAWSNALAVSPVARGDHEAARRDRRNVRLLRALDVCLPRAHGAIRADVLFVRGRVNYQMDDLDAAIAAFGEVVTKHPQHPSAEHAAMLLLDALNAHGQTDEMVQWIDAMRGTPMLVSAHPVLAQQLDGLHVDSQRRLAEDDERAAVAGDPQGYARCAAHYDRLYRAHPSYARRVELLYNAGVCHERAGDRAAAWAAFDEVRTAFATSALATKADERAGRLER